jgi:hypothetical protein
MSQNLEKGYSWFVMNGVTFQAKKSDGGRFYFIILPDGERMRHLAEVFETVAKPVPNAGFPKGD